MPLSLVEPKMDEVSISTAHRNDKKMVLTESRLKALWEGKYINDGPFILLALLMEDEDEPLTEINVPAFISDWQGDHESKKGERKELKPETVRKTLISIQSKGGLQIKESSVIQLSLLEL